MQFFLVSGNHFWESKKGSLTIVNLYFEVFPKKYWNIKKQVLLLESLKIPAFPSFFGQIFQTRNKFSKIISQLMSQVAGSRILSPERRHLDKRLS